MTTLRTRLRTVLSYGISAVLCLQLFSSALFTNVTHAAEGNLVINEINWAGSTGHADDEWVELLNDGASTINFAVTPYQLDIKDGEGTLLGQVDLGALTPSVAAGKTLVISNADVTSSLDQTALAAQLYTPVPAMVSLPNMPTTYVLSEVGVGEVDSLTGATPTDEPPFKGSAGDATHSIASMERVNPAMPGTDPANWRSASVIGGNFLNGVMQLGTPGAQNVHMVAPNPVKLAPAFHVTAPDPIKFKGKVDSQSLKSRLTIERQGPVPGTSTEIFETISNYFTGSVVLEPGRYMFDVASYDGEGNTTTSTPIMAGPGSTERNYVVLAQTSIVDPVTLGAYPAYTNQATVTMTGTVPDTATYAEVDILQNGEYLMTVPVVDGAFSAVVPMVPNSSNMLQFVAVASTGVVSVPVAATIVHDNIAPLAVDLTKVEVGANLPGSQDTLKGLAGAAEAGTSLMFFADAAATQPILSAALTVDVDGSFVITNIGDNKYAKVYLRLTDLAGNMSPVVGIDNPIGFVLPSTGLGLKVDSLAETQVKLSWTAVPNAVNYKLKYKTTDGVYTSAMSLCATGMTCSTDATLINLTADTNYVVAVAAVDKYGNETPYTELMFHTLAPAVVVTPVATTVDTPVQKSTTSSRRVSPAPTPKAEVTDTKATDEKGDVKSAADEAASRNMTPWIVLAILLAIAVLATLGYFYWFGGVAGEAALAAAGAAKKREEDNAEKSTASTKKTGKDKRW